MGSGFPKAAKSIFRCKSVKRGRAPEGGGGGGTGSNSEGPVKGPLLFEKWAFKNHSAIGKL